MPKIEAWKCPHTGKLFEQHSKYKSHLAGLSRQRNIAKRRQQHLDAVDAVILGEQYCQNAQELCEYIIANSEAYLAKGMLVSRNGDELRTAIELGYDIEWPKLTGMKLHQTRWNDCQSNSHSSPRGKPQNFRSDPDVPKGYPGWRGNLRVWHDKDAKVVITDKKGKKFRYRIPYFSDCVKNACGIYTGTGGGLDDGYYCDFTMFAEDYPEIEKQIIVHTLSGRFTEKASWNSPAFPVLDKLGEGRTGFVKDGDPF